MFGSTGTVGSWFRKKVPVTAVLVGVMLSSCAALPFVIPPLLEFGRNLLFTASQNYSPRYGEDLKSLLTALASPYVQTAFPGRPTNRPYIAPGSPFPSSPEGGYSTGAGNTLPFPPNFGETGISPTYGSLPLALDVAILRQVLTSSGKVPVPIQDGEVLKDGRGNPQAGDKFKLVFRANSNCYVYIVSIDGSGWAQGLFPSKSSSFFNPVSQNREYTLPERAYWFSLDQYRGVETIFFVASPTQRPDIEAILTTIAGRERPPGEVPLQVQQAPVIPTGYSGTQTGQPAPIMTESGETQQVTPTTYFSNQAGQDLRVTRWFRHE